MAKLKHLNFRTTCSSLMSSCEFWVMIMNILMMMILVHIQMMIGIWVTFCFFVPHYSCRRLRVNKNREEEKIKFLPNLGGMFSKSYPLPRTNGNCLLRRSKSGANPHSIFGKCTIFKSVRDTSLPDLLCLNCVFQIQLLKSTVMEYALQRNTLIERVIQDNWHAQRSTCSILQLLVGTLTTV